MSTKPKPKATPDSATFNHLPQKTKDLMRMQDQEEKTIGAGQVEITEKIDDARIGQKKCSPR